MGLDKPYYRIARPGKNIKFEYCKNDVYANDRSELCRAYYILQKDLKKIFEFIEPCEENLCTYSHRLYELLLRACTEFENNCKRILTANGYEDTHMNIKDYYKINKALKLSEYKLTIDFWRGDPIRLKPFDEWNDDEYHPLNWYQDYNNVKHDRNYNFKRASLENVISAVAGVLVTLYSQFNYHTFTVFQLHDICFETLNNNQMTIAESLFKIEETPEWHDNEKYDFDWNNLKKEEDPFQEYDFNDD
ncbi:MAG: hypothetical protein FXF47_08485 [Candidatus Mcinerneyibacterium aminivorans]|uniref:Uncharacterized protein n=1 Tax=Candidatus Mcinerneyibacterium aminivorans TaxID=2703815 RepID=A0A5D0MDX8_9BACT|nr:MAG: hypothetical protein FXF47_08485 [Candidatus Mcinerneyibacterium aminivorans]